MCGPKENGSRIKLQILNPKKHSTVLMTDSLFCVYAISAMLNYVTAVQLF